MSINRSSYHIVRSLGVLVSCLLLTACMLTPIAQELPSPSASVASGAAPETPDAVSSTASPTAATSSTSAPSSGGWTLIDSAMEARTMELRAGNSTVPASIIRFDPQAYRVSVKYDPFEPGFLNEWNDALQPLAMINGGFFDENDRATGLVIFDGVARGETYQGFGGMVVINAAGQFELRSLRQQPYDPNEPLQQAMQSAPMLIQPGGEISDLDADEDRSRRSVIAQDRQGRVLLIAVDLPLVTLPELAQALAQSDLDLDAALALDGGRSTGLYVNSARQRIAVNSFDEVPLVLTVERLDG
jgi:exopolysaccharide biosynthesis protein